MTSSSNSRNAEQEPLTKEQLAEFQTLLEGKRSRILQEDIEELEAAREDEQLRMSDEVDLASAEYAQAFEHRIRDRERKLLGKVEKALKRIQEGEYDECESCANYIGFGRLQARPEASLCIECKEEQERIEKNFSKQRQGDRSNPFK